MALAHPKKPAGDRRREIADAALRVIARDGLGRFTAAAIAAEVGLTDGALFRHFPSMDAIVDAAIDRVEEHLFEGFPPEADDPLERLGAFFRRRVAVARERPGISRLVATDELARAGSGEGAARAAEFRRRSFDFVSACLAEAKRRRLLAPGLGVEEATVVVLGAILALAHFPVPAAEGAISRIAPRAWSTLEAFLRGRPSRSRGAGGRPPRRSGRRNQPGEKT